MSTLLKEVFREMIKDGGLKSAGDLHSYLKDMFKDVLQEMLEAELDAELGYDKGDRVNKDTDNRRNGHSDKRVKSNFRDMDIKVLRDRNSEFEPTVVPKNVRNIPGIEDKIIPKIKEWQSRPLKPVYPFVFMDAIHYKVREDGCIKSKATYIYSCI